MCFENKFDYDYNEMTFHLVTDLLLLLTYYSYFGSPDTTVPA